MGYQLKWNKENKGCEEESKMFNFCSNIPKGREKSLTNDKLLILVKKAIKIFFLLTQSTLGSDFRKYFSLKRLDTL